MLRLLSKSNETLSAAAKPILLPRGIGFGGHRHSAREAIWRRRLAPRSCDISEILFVAYVSGWRSCEK